MKLFIYKFFISLHNVSNHYFYLIFVRRAIHYLIQTKMNSKPFHLTLILFLSKICKPVLHEYRSLFMLSVQDAL